MWVSGDSGWDQAGGEVAWQVPSKPLGLLGAEFQTKKNEKTGPEEPSLAGTSAKVPSQEELPGSR